MEVVRTRITLECTECKQRNYNISRLSILLPSTE
ncbi:MAG: 50S ribosomal protein L33 [Lachnospiraceae bacterium]|nr:50S ribosomal protein L33 [Lachnospiraceae bacterium]